MELIMAETLVGKYLITRNIDTARYGFAASVETMVVDFLPLLEITWKGQVTIKMVYEIITDEKRKRVNLISDSSKYWTIHYQNT